MKIDPKKRGDVMVVQLGGEFDFHDVTSAADTIGAFIDQGVHRLLFDLKELQFISSGGIGYFIQTAKRLKALGGELVLASPPDSFGWVIQTLGIDRVLKIFPDVLVHDDGLITFARPTPILPDGDIAGVLRPDTTVVLDEPQSVVGQCRQPRRVPLLAASDALPLAAGLDCCCGERRRCVAQRTSHRAESGRFLVHAFMLARRGAAVCAALNTIRLEPRAGSRRRAKMAESQDAKPENPMTVRTAAESTQV